MSGDNTRFEIRQRLSWLKENPVDAERVRRTFDLQGAEFRKWCPFCPCLSRRLGGETGLPSRVPRGTLTVN